MPPAAVSLSQCAVARRYRGPSCQATVDAVSNPPGQRRGESKRYNSTARRSTSDVRNAIPIRVASVAS
jgi:hypothetical protein